MPRHALNGVVVPAQAKPDRMPASAQGFGEVQRVRGLIAVLASAVKLKNVQDLQYPFPWLKLRSKTALRAILYNFF